MVPGDRLTMPRWTPSLPKIFKVGLRWMVSHDSTDITMILRHLPPIRAITAAIFLAIHFKA